MDTGGSANQGAAAELPFSELVAVTAINRLDELSSVPGMTDVNNQYQQQVVPRSGAAVSAGGGRLTRQARGDFLLMSKVDMDDECFMYRVGGRHLTGLC